MQVSIRNFRGVKSADFVMTRVALIAGDNAAGKSSVAQGVAAALTGEPIPLDGMKRGDAGMLVHAGTGRGDISIETAQGRIKVTYPQAKVTTEGTPPAASPFAVGRRSLIGMDPKEASTVLIEYLKALPTEADLRAAAASIGLPDQRPSEGGKVLPSAVDQLWTLILDLGWDGAHARAKETGVKLKGGWEHVTGERYGSAKAETWMPKDWDSDLTGASEEGLAAIVTQAREFVEAAIAAAAVSAADRDRLQAEADRVPALKSAADDAKKAADAAAADVRAKFDALEKMPKPSARKYNLCPHCDGRVWIVASEPGVFALMKADNTTAVDDQAKADAVEAARRAHADAVKAHAAADRNAHAAGLALKAARDCADKIAQMGVPANEAGALEQVRERAAKAEKRLAAFKAKREADRLHTAVVTNADVVAVLAPEGLRLRKLRAAVSAFNVALRAKCEAAGWGTVEVQEDLMASYDGKPPILLSASEVFRARVVIQCAMADIDQSAAVIVDAADILSAGGRNGLMQLLLSSPRPALVCMTIDARDRVPSAPGMVDSWWIEGGTAAAVTGA